MEYKVCTIALDDICLEDTTFRITTKQDKSSLRESVHKFGLLQLPAVWRSATGLVIVSGFRRVLACRELGIQAIPARLLADELQPRDCLRLAITENITQRPLNLVEMARAVWRLTRYCPPGHKTSDEFGLLGLPTSRTMIAKLDRLRCLPPDLQEAVVDGLIGLNTALEIGDLERRDQIALRRLFVLLHASIGKQKDILSMIREIAGRDKITVAGVLHADEVHAIVDDDQLDRNQKTTILRRYLKMVRYPHLTAFEARYHAAVRSLKLGPKMRIDPPANFEGTTFTLSLKFTNRHELEAAHRKIGNILQNAAIDNIFLS